MTFSTISKDKEQSFSILINQWSNLSKGYKTVAEIKGSLFGLHVQDFQVVYPNHDGEFSSIGLGRPGETHKPDIIESLRLSGFAKKLACTVDSEIGNCSDLVELVKRGSREINAISIVVDDRNVDSRLIRDRDTLNSFLENLHVALNKHELNGLLSESNRDSLLNTKGEQPKVIYQDEKGDSWIVKTDIHQLTSLDDVTAKTEFALLSAMAEAGMDVPESKMYKTDENRNVLMVKRYDVDSPYFTPDSANAKYHNRYRTVSAQELLNQSDMSSGPVTYATLVNSIANTYAQPKQADEIKQRMMERALFDAMVNNTETTPSTLNFFVNDGGDNSIRIAPMTGLSSDQMGNAFLLPISEKYKSQTRIKLDDEFAKEVSKVFEIDIGRVKRTIAKISSSVLAMEVHMGNAGMDQKERFYAKDAIMPKETLRAGLALGRDADALDLKSQSQQAFNMVGRSKSSTPSMS